MLIEVTPCLRSRLSDLRNGKRTDELGNPRQPTGMRLQMLVDALDLVRFEMAKIAFENVAGMRRPVRIEAALSAATVGAPVARELAIFMQGYVRSQVHRCRATVVAKRTRERLLARVRPHVHFEVHRKAEIFAADVALERALSCMRSHVDLEKRGENVKIAASLPKIFKYTIPAFEIFYSNSELTLRSPGCLQR